VLITFGLGNHPAIAKLLYNIGQKTKNDDISGTGNTGGGEKKLPTEKVLWPSMQS
jgi:hypothetical protein